MNTSTSPLLLVLESSSSLASVALLTPRGMALREDAGLTSKASDTMLAMVDAVLSEQGVSKRELQVIAYGQGPGAFTGLRTACAVAQGIAFGLQLPTIGVTSLEAVAEQAVTDTGAKQVMAVMDARMNEVYAQALVRDEAGYWSGASAIQVSPISALAWPAGGQWQGAGNAWHSAELSEALRVATPEYVKLPQQASLPHAREVAALALRQWAAAKPGVSLQSMMAEPLYVRDRVAQTTAQRLAAKAQAAV